MERPDDMTPDELRLAHAAEIDEPDDDPEELESETSEEESDEPGIERITSHTLRCRQGLGGNYVYDDSKFQPPATGIVWTRVAFYDGNMHRLLLTAWKNMGSANPYRTMSNRWTWRDSQRVRRALVIWHQNGWNWQSWDSC